MLHVADDLPHQKPLQVEVTSSGTTDNGYFLSELHLGTETKLRLMLNCMVKGLARIGIWCFLQKLGKVCDTSATFTSAHSEMGSWK